jgi:16S rRNA (cytidine1402-2'-O)-methyltransferase
LSAASNVFGIRQIVLAREVTKVHQQFLRGTAGELSNLLTTPRGEFTVVVGPSVSPESDEPVGTDDELGEEFRQTTEHGGLSRRAAILTVARKFRRSPNEVYAAIERLKK